MYENQAAVTHEETKEKRQERLRKARNKRARENRAMRDDALRSIGLTKYKSSSGETIWE